MKTLLAVDPIPTIFGKITPPPGSKFVGTDPVRALAAVIVNGIRLVFLAAAILSLIYLFWGGIDWILSGGDKERVAKARQKLTNAIIGLFIVILSVTIFSVVTGDILGIIVNTGSGWEFRLPVFGPPVQSPPVRRI